MGTLKSIQPQSTLDWMNALYQDDSGEYEVVFTRSYDENIGYESRELVNVEKAGAPIYPEEPIWKEIQEQIQAAELGDEHDSISFTVEVNKGLLEPLDNLIAMVLSGSKASPEEALEIGIFSQIQEQLRKKPVVETIDIRCHKCKGPLVYIAYVSGQERYPINNGIIDHKGKTFRGTCFEHELKCADLGCNAPQPTALLLEILERSDVQEH